MKRKKVDDTVYDSGKRSYCERRGGLFRAANPRQLRQLESKLRDKTIVACQWTSESLVTIVFSSGVIAYLSLKPSTLDVIQILFDRYFVSKLSGQTVSNVAICKSYILLTHSDRTATLVTFGKNNINLPCRIKDRDPHIQSIELSGSSRKTERYISTSEFNGAARVLVWSVTVAEPAPWSPIIEDHANLHLYSINGHQVTLSAYHQLENETLSADMSFKGDNVVHIVEQISSHKNGINLEWVRYDVSKIERTCKLSWSTNSATRVSLSTPVRAVRRAVCDTRLLIACIDGSIHVVHSVVGVTHTARAGFIATDIRWAGELIIASDESGRLQCFDRALSLLHQNSKYLELTSYTHSSDARRMQILCERSARDGPLLCLWFSGGPLALLHLAHPRLITAWIRMKRSSNAVALLRAMDWDREGTECLWATNKLVCTALTIKSEEENGETVAQSALGAFLAPSAPLSAAASRFAPPVHDLARKFFHHLLRRGRVEKALSLAVDLADWDLFSDARWAATRCGLQPLASEAAALATLHAHNIRTGSECSGSCSDCSSQSYSESDEPSSASEKIKTKPPPLPRLSVPKPTVMQVAITQAEPTSTHSIRPNLHQYLERDNTIWTTDILDTYPRREYQPKPIQSAQTVRWHSMDMLTNYKHSLVTINENPLKPARTIDTNPRSREECTPSSHFKHLYHPRESIDTNNMLYLYQNNNNYSMKNRTYRTDNDVSDKQAGRPVERNKVKFSDTVTVAVVSESEMGGAIRRSTTPTGSTLDYVEV